MKRISILFSAVALGSLMALIACATPATPPPAQVVKETVVVTVKETGAPVVQTVVAQQTVVSTVKETVVVPAAEKQQLVYNSYQSDPEPRKADAEIVKMFMEKNPNINVTHSTVAHEDFKQAIRAYLTASTPPDVMTWFAGNRARFFIDKGQIMDISDVWKDQGWDKSYPKGFMALSSVDGKQYFVPTSYYWWAMYYNKKVFDQYKIAEPKTFDDLLAACKTLKSNGITPITVGSKAPWTLAGWFDYLNMRTNGPEFHINLMLGKEKYDDPRVKETFANWKKMLDAGCFQKDSASYNWQDVVPDLVAGKAGMYLMGQFIMDSIPKEDQANFDFFQFPIINPNVKIGEDAPTDGFFAAANAPDPDAAKKFLAFLGSKEVQEYYAKNLKRLPINTEVDTSSFDDAAKKGMKMLGSADYVAQFYDRDTTPEMAEKGMAAFAEFMTNPEKIDAILAQLEKDRALIFETPQ